MVIFVSVYMIFHSNSTFHVSSCLPCLNQTLSFCPSGVKKDSSGQEIELADAKPDFSASQKEREGQRKLTRLK